MTAPPPLHPTLWRTCRAITNRTCLQIFALLVEQPGQTVSAVATRLRPPLLVASQYLRTLEARGFVTCRQGMYAVAGGPGAFGCELARLAGG